MPKAALNTDISNTAVEEEMRFSKTLGIQCQAFIMRERSRASIETSRESRKIR
jgi:hypothetical protein